MPLEEGSSQAAVKDNIAQLISEGYSPEQASAIAYKKAGSARTTDLNGYIEIRDNPISKVGVFDYSGAQLGFTDERAGRIFKVYRPAEELADPECIESFRLLPFVDEHAMLGSEEMGLTPAEKKGVQGYIGEQVRFDPPYLRANIKILSESAKRLIESGKRELSPGYRCVYELTTGVFEGQNYDAVQRHIRGNHLALVQEGRTGPDVAVLDHMTFTIDAKELAAMADQETATGGSDIEKIKALIAELKPLIEQQAEAQAMLAELGLGMRTEEKVEIEEMDEEKVEAVIDEEVKAEVVEDKDAMDSKRILSALDSISKRLGKLESGTAAMDSAIVTSIAERDALAARLSPFVGVFDHKAMTGAQVAQYGCEKLGLKCAPGTERVALDAYLHNRTPEHKQRLFAVGQDSANVDLASAWAAQGSK